MKVSIRRKYQLYRIYKKNLLSHREELANEFGLRIDRVKRFYTVLNIPKELIEEPYDLRKQDIDILAEKYIREYITILGKYLKEIDLNELYKIYEIKKVSKLGYLVVFGYSQFDTAKVARNIYFKIMPTIIGLSALTWIVSKLF